MSTGNSDTLISKNKDHECHDHCSRTENSKKVQINKKTKVGYLQGNSRRNQKMKRNIGFRSAITSVFFFIFLSQVSALDPNKSRKIYEHQLIEGLSQPHTSYNYYNFIVGMRYYTGTEHLIIKLIPDSFESDPDLFISKIHLLPQDSSNSEWTCQRKGGETCIIHNGQFAVGDTFNIGVKCQRACTYKLYTHYTEVIQINDQLRTQVRFGQYSTNLLKFRIPSKIKISTRSIKTISAFVKVEPEDNQSYLEMFLSNDPFFNLLEEKPAVQIVDDGVAVKFSNKDINWCTKCYVYFVVNVYSNQRYYITAKSNFEEKEITKLTNVEVVINPFQQECYKYTVLRKKRDVAFWITEYSGHADAYLAAEEEATGPDDQLILFRDTHGPSRQIVLARHIRNWFGTLTGHYYLCFYAKTPFSASVQANEIDYEGTFEQEDSQMMTTVIAQKSFFKSKMTNIKLNQESDMHIYVAGQEWKEMDPVAEMYYKICGDSVFENCMLNDDEEDMIHVKLEQQETGIFNGNIRHNPKNCPDPNSCIYFFRTNNPTPTVKVITIKAEITIYNPQDVDLSKEYLNVVQYGQFINYEINEISNEVIQPFISKLVITVETMIGDADLFVSFDSANPTMHNFEYQSKQIASINQVTLIEKENNWLNRPIFFSIFGNAKSEVRIRFSFERKAALLSVSQISAQLSENSNLNQVVFQEKEVRFYHYKPWWTGREKRTIIFIADMVFNKVFFYAQWNEYPRHFRTSLHDENDLISIFPNNPQYHFTGGQYYIRLRPDFALFDMLTGRQYQYNMIAFSQAQHAEENNKEQQYEDLQLEIEQYGYIKNSQYQDYRYLQIDMEANYEIRVKRIPLRGKPKFYVKTIDEGSGWSARENNFHYESRPDPIKNESQQFMLSTPEQRLALWPKCDKIQRSLQVNGQIKCFIAIGVTCDDNKECAFSIKIRKVYKNENEQSQDNPAPPGTLTLTDFLNSKVSKNEIKYYYFPFDATETKDILITLNKTQIYGTGQNGNCKLVASFQPTIDNPLFSYYKIWNFPTEENHDIESNTGKYDQPEFIQPSAELVLSKCMISSCAIIIGVIGQSDELSSFRIKAFNGFNKLRQGEPVDHSTNYEYAEEEVYDYFWFTISPKMEKFNYQISVATKGKTTEGFNNPDLFVSLKDGRYPTIDDFDLQSTMQGADAISITSDMTIWNENKWDYNEGVLVAVSVRRTSIKVPFTLLLTTMEDFDLKISRLKVDTPILIKQPQMHDAVENRMFMFYNWEHKDVEITVLSRIGDVSLMYQKTGQNDYQNNIYTAIPISKKLSDKGIDVKQSEEISIKIKGNECYQCWYFIVLKVSNPENALYKLTVTKVPDQDTSSNKLPEILLDEPTQTYIASGFHNIRKFKLGSMENWVLEVLVQNGAVEIYVGLDVDTLSPQNYIWTTSTNNGIARLEVQTTDINFHMSTYYFVEILSVGGMDAIVSLTLKQQKLVHFLTHNHDSTFTQTAPIFNQAILFQKFQFQTDQEIMKRHVFQVPGNEGRSIQNYKVKIYIEALTEHFYPMIFLNKYETVTQVKDYSQMQYPDLNNYDLAVGQNPFESLNKDKFEYTFSGASTDKWAYYTMALYEHNWGLTDIRKSEYQIRIEADKSGPRVDASAPVSVPIDNSEPKVEASAPVSTPVDNLIVLQN